MVFDFGPTYPHIFSRMHAVIDVQIYEPIPNEEGARPAMTD